MLPDQYAQLHCMDSCPGCRKRRVLFGSQPALSRDNDKRNTALGLKEAVVDKDVEIFADNGRLAVELDMLVAIVASDNFTPMSFIERYMGHLSGSGFEAARQELDRVMGYVSNQVCQIVQYLVYGRSYSLWQCPVSFLL